MCIYVQIVHMFISSVSAYIHAYPCISVSIGLYVCILLYRQYQCISVDMFISVYISVPVYIVYICQYLSICIYLIICLYQCISVYISEYVYICSYVHIREYCSYLFICLYLCICLYPCRSFVSVHICPFVYFCLYVCICKDRVYLSNSVHMYMSDQMGGGYSKKVQILAIPKNLMPITPSGIES